MYSVWFYVDSHEPAFSCSRSIPKFTSVKLLSGVIFEMGVIYHFSVHNFSTSITYRFIVLSEKIQTNLYRMGVPVVLNVLTTDNIATEIVFRMYSTQQN